VIVPRLLTEGRPALRVVVPLCFISDRNLEKVIPHKLDPRCRVLRRCGIAVRGSERAS
jgi:hypothetical protein